MADPRTWILTGSPENHAATAARGYALSACVRVQLDAIDARACVGAR